MPFLYQHKRNKKNDGGFEIVITVNILHEIKEYQSRNNNSTNYTLAALSAEIPGFKPVQRWINGENSRVICGPKNHFYKFLSPNIEDREGELL